MVNKKNIPLQQCPCCNHILDSATPISGNPMPQPKAGGICVCINCGSILVYNKDSMLELPSINLLNELSKDYVFMRKLHRIRAALSMIKTPKN